MALLIPEVIDPLCPSPGERQLFEHLQDDPGTTGWKVIHSLDIARHVLNIEGEADFVALIPKRGVLCIEVKAHTKVRREGGAWYLGNDPPEFRGPFKQAKQACHSVRERVVSKNPGLGNIPFGWIVVFTHCERGPERTSQGEWLGCQMLTSDEIWDDQGVGSRLGTALDDWRKHLAETRSAGWFDPETEHLTPREADEIARILRPDFEICETPASAARKRSEELHRFTQEQFVALDAIRVNPRVLFEGPAGTGKTVLALEAARRMGISGQRVALVCFNRLLGRWLAIQASGYDNVEFVGTIDKLLMDELGVERLSQDGFKSLPEDALEVLTDPGSGARPFDVLIFDEAQDVVTERYLETLEALLKGGLKFGSWYAFGDFTKQALSVDGEEADRSVARLMGDIDSPRAARLPLSINCRNTPRVASFLEFLARPSSPYARVLRPDNHRGVTSKFWKNRDAQVSLLEEAINGLIEDGFYPHEIVVLSANAADDSTACQLARSTSEPVLAEFDDQALDYLSGLADGHNSKVNGASASEPDLHGSVRYTTIRKFKGLESPAVVLTDFEEILSDHSSNLFYTGITRTTESLTVLMHKGAQQDYARLLAQSQREVTPDD